MEQSEGRPRLITYWAEPGDPTPLSQLLPHLYVEVEEFQLRDYGAFCRDMVEQVETISRFEIVGKVNDEVVSAAVLVYEQDMHVGLCASVMWNYVVPEYRGAGIGKEVMRMVRELATEAGLQTYSYSHRLAPFQYIVKYRRT